MASARATIDLDIPADYVWKLIGDLAYCLTDYPTFIFRVSSRTD